MSRFSFIRLQLAANMPRLPFALLAAGENANEQFGYAPSDMGRK
jgi:hypothetical protein